jgi:hypothetical protein
MNAVIAIERTEMDIEMGIEVTLTDEETAYARGIGMKRQQECEKAGKKDRHGFKGNGVNIHILGAAGELAACKVFGLIWSASVNTFKGQADVGDVGEVRATTYKTGSLIVREDDQDDHVFILVTGQIPHLTIQGYMMGKDAKQKQWLSDRGNGRAKAYFVPQTAIERVV